MIRILIVDDHPVVRKGVRRILEEQIPLIQADEAAEAREALQRIKENTYNLILLDISLPDRSGITLLENIKALKPQFPVLILSMFPEKSYALRAIKSGASGYLTKDVLDEELVKAVNRILSGRKYISETLAELLIERNGNMGVLHEKLSNREFEVMISIAQGKTLKEIADTLGISEKTASTYKLRILEKLDFNNTAELIRYTIEEGLV